MRRVIRANTWAIVFLASGGATMAAAGGLILRDVEPRLAGSGPVVLLAILLVFSGLSLIGKSNAWEGGKG